MGKAIDVELINQFAQLEKAQQEKVLTYVQELLEGKDLFDKFTQKDMLSRAEASEQDIASGQTKSGQQFKDDFEAWKKKARECTQNCVRWLFQGKDLFLALKKSNPYILLDPFLKFDV